MELHADSYFSVFIFAFIVSTSSAIKCQIYFRRGKSAPKINKTDDCESSSCCFTAELYHNRHAFQIKGCDSDDIQDNMLIYIPLLTGRPWENIMEACLASECRFHHDLLGGKGKSRICGCDADYCNRKSFQETFPELKSEPRNRTISAANMPNDNLLWIIGGTITIIREFSYNF
ncbi:hypothetical protein DINM_001391 [Dirofilaria immitis]|nr:hypothetical protein [Dirofilaria immitis]